MILNDESRVDFLEGFRGKFIEVTLTDKLDVDIVTLFRVDLPESDATIESVSVFRHPSRRVECRWRGGMS